MPSLAQIRTVFFGSPWFALPSLEALHAAGANLVGVVTQPDKPAGRGHRMTASPVKTWAEQHGLPVFQPKELKKEESRAFLHELKPYLLVVVAYGKILPKEALDLSKFGAVNVHASLLPKYRGPAPIPAAILAGNTETGVTIMKLDEGIDTGPMLAQERVPIAPDDTTGTLSKKLAELGAQILIPTLEKYIRHELSPATRSLPSTLSSGSKGGEVWPAPQDDTQATVCRMIKKDDARIDWLKPAEFIARMVRAYDPWPGTYTTWNGRRLLIHRAAAVPASSTEDRLLPGAITYDSAALKLGTGDGILFLKELQLEGRKRLPATEFLRGHPTLAGSVLG